MKIQINSDKQIAVDAKVSAAVESDVRQALEKYGPRLTRLEVHLSDTNSGSKRGLLDKRCLLEARPSGQRPVSVAFEAASVERAVRGAAAKMKRLLETSFGKSSEQTLQKSSRQTKRDSSSPASLEKLQCVQTALSEIFETDANDSPRLQRYMMTAIKALDEARLIVESQQETTESPAPRRSSTPTRKSVRAAKSTSPGGLSPRTRPIHRARRKAWPQG